MVVLPNIFYAPNALQPRAATGNSLGGGAIAGIVLGSLCGLLVLLVIFWTCRLGNSAFTKAKSFSTSAVDKAEKGHACAKDLYSAGRERHFQSSKIQDKAHYEEHNPEHQRGLEHLYRDISHPSDVGLLHSEHRTTPAVPCSIRTPPTISAVPSTCSLSHPAPLPSSLSPADTKPVVIDTKRVLGIDDASYLDEIPFHDRKDSNLTAAPACVASSSKKPILHAIDPSARRWILNRLPSLSSKSGVPDEIDTTYAGTEIKYRRISELRGSETLPSPEESGTGYHNADHSSIPPISEVSPESVPAELYSPPLNGRDTIDYFAVSRTRRHGATRAEPANEEAVRTLDSVYGSPISTTHVGLGVDSYTIDSMSKSPTTFDSIEYTGENELSITSTTVPFQMTDLQHEFTYLRNTSGEYTAHSNAPTVSVRVGTGLPSGNWMETRSLSSSDNGWVDVHAPTIPAKTSLDIDSTNTVDPWEVEYQPNPVMFPHLPASVGNMQYQDEEEDPLFVTSLTSSPRLESMIEACGTSFESPPAMCALSTIPESEGTSSPIERINTEFSEISVPISESSTSDLSVDDTSPVTAASEVPPHYKRKSSCLNGLGTVEIINFAASISSERSPDDSDTSFTVLSSPRSLTIANSNAMTLSSQASSPTSPASNLSAPKATKFPSKLTEVDTDAVYPCSICHLKFRTPGLRRTHQNRKHNLRYPCGICNSRFGLRADLRRHENSVHRDNLHDISAKLFQCPNIGCSDPQKTYARKDNFTRHVNRCGRAIAKAKSLHNAIMEK